MYISNLQKSKDKGKNLKIIWDKEGMLSYGGARLGIITNFLSVNMRERIEQIGILNVLEKENLDFLSFLS